MSERIKALADAIHALTFKEMMSVSVNLKELIQARIDFMNADSLSRLDYPCVGEALDSLADGISKELSAIATSEKEGA